MLVYIYLFYYLLSFVTSISNLGVEQQRITSNYVKSQVTSLKSQISYSCFINSLSLAPLHDCSSALIQLFVVVLY